MGLNHPATNTRPNIAQWCDKWPRLKEIVVFMKLLLRQNNLNGTGKRGFGTYELVCLLVHVFKQLEREVRKSIFYSVLKLKQPLKRSRVV